MSNHLTLCSDLAAKCMELERQLTAERAAHEETKRKALEAEKWKGIALAKFGDGRTVQQIETPLKQRISDLEAQIARSREQAACCEVEVWVSKDGTYEETTVRDHELDAGIHKLYASPIIPPSTAELIEQARREEKPWNSIETAPKDGTHITLDNERDLPTTCHWFDGAWHLSMNRYGPFSEWTWDAPTRWKPL